MSHWIGGKIDNKCSIAELRKALERIMPQWKEFIRVDPSGGLSIYNPYETNHFEPGFHIVIPGGQSPMGGKIPGVRAAPGLPYADIGIKQQEDGSWTFRLDPAGLSEDARNIAGSVTREVGREKVERIVTQAGGTITGQDREGAKLKIRLLVPRSGSRGLMTL